MLRVIVELRPSRGGDPKVIATGEIANVGGTNELGDYDCCFSEATEAGTLKERARGTVEGHSRLTSSVWSLVWKALLPFAFEVKPEKPSARCPGLRERPPLTHVAVRDSEGAVWSMPRPFRHHHVLKMMHDHGAKQDRAEPEDRQGFLDAHGHYLTRKQAMVNADLNHQLIGGKTIANILTSEDLW